MRTDPSRPTAPRAAGLYALLATLVVGNLTLMPATAHAQAGRLPLDSAGQPLVTLSPVIKRVSPAVVNIATKGTVTEKAQRNPLLEDPFFRRFFDAPGQARWSWHTLEDAELERAASLLNDGLSATEMACALGVSRASGYRLRQRALQRGLLGDKRQGAEP